MDNKKQETSVVKTQNTQDDWIGISYSTLLWSQIKELSWIEIQRYKETERLLYDGAAYGI